MWVTLRCVHTINRYVLEAKQFALFAFTLNTVWRETLVVGKFGELSAKLPLAK